MCNDDVTWWFFWIYTLWTWNLEIGSWIYRFMSSTEFGKFSRLFFKISSLTLSCIFLFLSTFSPSIFPFSSFSSRSSLFPSSPSFPVSLHSFWSSSNMNVYSFAEALLIFFSLFSFYCSDCVNSIDIFLSSPLLSSVISIQLWSPNGEIFILVIVIFSSIISIGLFYNFWVSADNFYLFQEDFWLFDEVFLWWLLKILVWLFQQLIHFDVGIFSLSFLIYVVISLVLGMPSNFQTYPGCMESYIMRP